MRADAVQSSLIAHQVTDVALAEDIRRYMEQNPDKTRADAIKFAVKFTIPASIVGSPSYYRNQLHNLVRCAKVCVA